MKVQYLVLLFVLVAILARDVVCARKENEPDEDEPDEEEPDENEPNEHGNHNKHQHAAATSTLYPVITHHAHAHASHSSVSPLGAISAAPSAVASSSSWVGSDTSSSMPSIAVARPVTGLATSASNRLQISFCIASIGILAIGLALL